MSLSLKLNQSIIKYSNLNIWPWNVNCRLDIPLQVSITPQFGSLHKCFIYVSCDSAWEVTRGGSGRGCEVMKVKQGWVRVPPSPWLFTQEEGLVPTCASWATGACSPFHLHSPLSRPTSSCRDCRVQEYSTGQRALRNFGFLFDFDVYVLLFMYGK